MSKVMVVCDQCEKTFQFFGLGLCSCPYCDCTAGLLRPWYSHPPKPTNLYHLNIMIYIRKAYDTEVEVEGFYFDES